ncbi:MAG: DNA recombination protein RmuC [Firmicutes bacterium]|nr:DNA recombination protein RmuC [Bacillota bacterium]
MATELILGILVLTLTLSVFCFILLVILLTKNGKKQQVNIDDSKMVQNTVNVMESYMRMTEDRFRTFAAENNQKLDGIRDTVDKRVNESFELVNDRLEQVYKGLGEMQNLAAGVGDLKKVLSNVKTRGILGEVQLAAILEDILSPEQYDTNVATKQGSRAVVEFAVKIPSDDGYIYLPIDAKFPGETYGRLRDAIESGNQLDINEAAKLLTATIKSEAKDIRDKYIDPPNTTDFAIMFLPFEGLYAEVVNRGLIEVLQRDYSVNIAGPSTMAALLNSLQMGFRSFAIQQRSSEVWNVLSAVKTEFNKFESTLKATQQRISQANDELDKLVGVRTRQIQRKLKSVSELDDLSSAAVLELDDEEVQL